MNFKGGRHVHIILKQFDKLTDVYGHWSSQGAAWEKRGVASTSKFACGKVDGKHVERLYCRTGKFRDRQFSRIWTIQAWHGILVPKIQELQKLLIFAWRKFSQIRRFRKNFLHAKISCSTVIFIDTFHTIRVLSNFAGRAGYFSLEMPPGLIIKNAWSMKVKLYRGPLMVKVISNLMIT